MNNNPCSAEADILSKYQDMFPSEFIESVRKGVSWLCTHNNITYQTSIMVASDRVLYNTAGSSVLRIGLINTDLPLTGLTYYEVKSIEVAKDEVSGSTIFNVKMKYTTPMGINVSLVPIIYFDPEIAPEFYSKSEIDNKFKELSDLINTNKEAIEGKADASATNDLINGLYDQLENNVKEETVTKLEAKVDDMLQSLALDFVTNEKLDEELAKLQSGDKELDLSTYLKVKDAEAKYATTESITELNNKVDNSVLDTYATKDYVTTEIGKVQASSVDKDEVVAALKADNDFKTSIKGEKGEKGDTGATGSEGPQGPQGEAGKSVTVDEVKSVVVEALKQDEDFKNSVKGTDGNPGKDGVSPSASDVATEVKDNVVAALKNDDTFKNSVKGEKGDNGKDADTSTLATKEELKEKLDASTYNTDKTEFVTNTNLATTLGDYLKTADADNKYALKADS